MCCYRLNGSHGRRCTNSSSRSEECVTTCDGHLRWSRFKSVDVDSGDGEDGFVRCGAADGWLKGGCPVGVVGVEVRFLGYVGFGGVFVERWHTGCLEA